MFPNGDRRDRTQSRAVVDQPDALGFSDNIVGKFILHDDVNDVHAIRHRPADGRMLRDAVGQDCEDGGGDVAVGAHARGGFCGMIPYPSATEDICYSASQKYR